ncbi:MAG: hypothetical protein AAF497_02530 [Planctomycetota bacterium]
MNNTSPSVAISNQREIPSRSRLLALVMLLGIIAALTQGVYQWAATGTEYYHIAFTVYLIALIGTVSFLCGYSDDPKWLKWTSFLWVFALVNLQLFSIPSHNSPPLPAVTLYASQFGLLATWLIMSPYHLMRRIIASIILTSLLWRIASGTIHSHWFVIFAIFLTALAITLLFLRLLGFRLESINLSNGDKTLGAVQFGLQQAMLLTTALAIMFGVLKSQGQWIMGYFPNLVSASTLVLALIGLASVIVSVAACWFALGKGQWIIRATFFLVTVSTFGGLTAYSFTDLHQKLMSRKLPFRSWQWQLWQLASIEWLWIWWFILSGSMLVAALLFFRSQGLRFVRRISA